MLADPSGLDDASDVAGRRPARECSELIQRLQRERGASCAAVASGGALGVPCSCGTSSLMADARARTDGLAAEATECGGEAALGAALRSMRDFADRSMSGAASARARAFCALMQRYSLLIGKLLARMHECDTEADVRATEGGIDVLDVIAQLKARTAHSMPLHAHVQHLGTRRTPPQHVPPYFARVTLTSPPPTSPTPPRAGALRATALLHLRDGLAARRRPRCAHRLISPIISLHQSEADRDRGVSPARLRRRRRH